MKINRKLLPIKAHFFFFMCAMGPILPQLQVFGKELGISSVVMGSVTGILPFTFLLAKPLFGMVVDIYRDYRKAIFIFLIIIMTTSYALIGIIPPRPLLKFHFDSIDDVSLDTCNVRDLETHLQCNNLTTSVECRTNCYEKPIKFLANNVENSSINFRLCTDLNVTNILRPNCSVDCSEDIENDNGCLYKTFTFWAFIILMSVGTIGFNVINSISDAICFDVIGDEYDYGKQRLWGTIGFGITALISGFIVDTFSKNQISYIPAFIVMGIFAIIDVIACCKLKLPIIEAPENILKEFKRLLNNRHVVIFMIFAIFAGIVDSFIVYFLFWYIEDLAEKTNTTNIKLLEGLIVAAETLGGEVIFFSIAGKILERIGHIHCFSMCFINYALRLGLISLAPTPWWILPIEFVFQGPTYALTYTSIVAYANELSPPGASATMQGIAAGMDDGIGYAIGSMIGGLLYKYIGGQQSMQVFSMIAVVCGIIHLMLHKTILSGKEPPISKATGGDYKSPEDALKVTYQN